MLNKDHLLKGTRMGPPSHKEKRRWTEFLGSYNREPIFFFFGRKETEINLAKYEFGTSTN